MANRRRLDKRSPLTSEVVAEVEVASEQDVLQAVERARLAAPGWRRRGVQSRLALLKRLRTRLEEKADDYARQISEDTGKPLVDALMTELLTLPLFLDHYERTAPAFFGRKKVKTPLVFFGKRSFTEATPIGVVAIISPWNFPFQLAVLPALTALIAGNTVVLKPSEITPLTADLIEDLFGSLNLPDGVFEMVRGDGVTGAALTRAPVDKIFFTGSVATGRKVMRAAAEGPIPVELELGGKDAMIVCADANLERAARAAVWGGLLNCGQACVSVERIFVEAEIHDRFVGMLEREIAKVRVGGPDESADMGPLTFEPQIAIVERYLEDAREKGATIHTGGARLPRPGQFFAPTLLSGVTQEMAIYQEETFGPVLPVMKVRSVEEAIDLTNAHELALTASIFTADVERGAALATWIDCGQVMVNDVISGVANPALPFGGNRRSGFGRYHGEAGLRSFTNEKGIMVDSGRFVFEPSWFPYAGKYEAVKDVFNGVLKKSLPSALLGLAKLRK